jgi:hypothetical protein
MKKWLSQGLISIPIMYAGELWLDTGRAAIRAGSYPFERVVVRCVGSSRYEDGGVELAQPVAEALAGCTVCVLKRNE